jgi:hypothetical protein
MGTGAQKTDPGEGTLDCDRALTQRHISMQLPHGVRNSPRKRLTGNDPADPIRLARRVDSLNGHMRVRP